MERLPDPASDVTFVQAKVDMIGRLLTDVASGGSDVIREVLGHGGAKVSDLDVERARYVLPWKSYWDLRELNVSSPDLVSQEMVDTAWKICGSFYGAEESEAAVQGVLSGLSEGLTLDEAAERALPAGGIDGRGA
jgi:hypothetical protein